MSVFYTDSQVTLHLGDALTTLRELPNAAVDCIVTSPPYWGLRDYEIEGQAGREATPAEYIASLAAVFREAYRVLADDGTCWLNIGDTYATKGRGPSGATSRLNSAGHRDAQTGPASDQNPDRPTKSLLGIPWRLAFALQDDGWLLRSDIIWHKTTAMPESVTDRPSRRHEHVFLFTKQARYTFNLAAIQEPINRQRPQRVRAEQLAVQHQLTPAHFDALRACGITDTGKAAALQTGAGRNTPAQQRLAAEARLALGGYYREFLNGGTKNAGDVWEIPAQPFPGTHFAVMPLALATRCVLAGSQPGGVVLDPFSGTGTTGLAATLHGRRYLGIDLNRDYLDLSLHTRLAQGCLDFGGDAA